MSRPPLLLLLSVLGTACVSQRFLDGVPDAAPGGTLDAAGSGPGGAAGGGAPDAAAGQCGATCGTPAGPVQNLNTFGDAYAALEGQWLICSGFELFTSGGAPADVIGVEFGAASTVMNADGGTAGGNMYYLVQGPTGPQRGSGLAYELTYDLSGPPPSFVLDMHPGPNSDYGVFFRYSPCPMEFELDIGLERSILVRAGGAAGAS